LQNGVDRAAEEVDDAVDRAAQRRRVEQQRGQRAEHGAGEHVGRVVHAEIRRDSAMASATAWSGGPGRPAAANARAPANDVEAWAEGYERPDNTGVSAGSSSSSTGRARRTVCFTTVFRSSVSSTISIART
jgi:hypothetical protein